MLRVYVGRTKPFDFEKRLAQLSSSVLLQALHTWNGERRVRPETFLSITSILRYACRESRSDHKRSHTERDTRLTDSRENVSGNFSITNDPIGRETFSRPVDDQFIGLLFTSTRITRKRGWPNYRVNFFLMCTNLLLSKIISKYAMQFLFNWNWDYEKTQVFSVYYDNKSINGIVILNFYKYIRYRLYNMNLVYIRMRMMNVCATHLCFHVKINVH